MNLPTDPYGNYYVGIQSRAEAAYAVVFGKESRIAVAAELSGHGYPRRAAWLLAAPGCELFAIASG